tara:strand:+ start:192 stop:509 length:318 start_codon:yes stop_codon:yes gene_type:complete
MLSNGFNLLDQVLSDGNNFITQGILLFGASAITIAGLIFLFPTFVGLLIAVAILIIGFTALLTGYRLWEVRTDRPTINPFYQKFEKIPSEKPRHYYFKIIRLQRW